MKQSDPKAVAWPAISFGPVNLWSFPAEWRRLGLYRKWKTLPATTSSSVHPTVLAMLQHR